MSDKYIERENRLPLLKATDVAEILNICTNYCRTVRSHLSGLMDLSEYAQVTLMNTSRSAGLVGMTAKPCNRPVFIYLKIKIYSG